MRTAAAGVLATRDSGYCYTLRGSAGLRDGREEIELKITGVAKRRPQGGGRGCDTDDGRGRGEAAGRPHADRELLGLNGRGSYGCQVVLIRKTWSGKT